MKLFANRGELLAICKHAAHIALETAAVPELRGVLLEADDAAGLLTVTATNFELSLQCRMCASVQEGGAIVINAKLLVRMLELLPGDQILLCTKDNQTVVLGSGSACYLVGFLAGRSFPSTEIPFPEDTVQVSGIPTLTRSTTFAVSESETQPILRCVNLIFSEDGLRAVGSDGSRVMSVKGTVKSVAAISLLIPAKSLETLAEMVTDNDALLVGTTGKSIVFLRDNFILSARLMDGAYINADLLLKSVTSVFTVLTDAGALWRALDAISPLAGDEDRTCLEFRGGIIKLSCNSAAGTSSRELEVIPLIGQSVGSYYYPLQKLAECLRALKGTLQLHIAQGGLLLMETENAVCLVNAVRPPVACRAAAEQKPPLAA